MRNSHIPYNWGTYCHQYTLERKGYYTSQQISFIMNIPTHSPSSSKKPSLQRHTLSNGSLASTHSELQGQFNKGQIEIAVEISARNMCKGTQSAGILL